MAYPMPFVLRWGGKGVGYAFAALTSCAFIGSYYLVTQFKNSAHIFTLSPFWVKFLAYGLPVLLIVVFYFVSCWVIERVEA